MSPDRVCAGFTYASLNACFAMGADTKAHLRNVRCPVLIQFGSKDPLLPNKNRESANQFASMLGSHSKAVHWYCGSHDMLNDRNTRPELLSDVNKWFHRLYQN
jgi:alpha-beta hydrolase superfamily lysophospholipase